MTKQIFLDMDGVLADWDGSVKAIFGEDYRNVSRSRLWRELDRLGEEFWYSLDPYPWTQDLYKLCQSIAPVHILTSPSKDPMCAAGKYMWLKEQFGNGFRDFFIGPHKYLMAQPGYVLIDDHEHHTDSFVTYGGTSILFPQDWNRNKEFQDDPMKYVRDKLEELKAG